MRAVIYARVSITDKVEKLNDQLELLRRFVKERRWKVYKEYSDQAQADNLRQRKDWQRLLEDAINKRFDVLIIQSMDRAFYSVTHVSISLEKFREWGVGVKSVSDAWLDTVTSKETPYEIAASYARLEKEMIHERLMLGMERSRKLGSKTGRPKVIDREGFSQAYGDILEGLSKGNLSRSQAAKKLGIGYATLKRLLDAEKVLAESL
ncbi:recombinase family protein [Dehalococcoides sp. THU3]|uniref:recombinase family protein n=2 Tax=Dehalococcoidaceae TaxID=1202464 RepID=UPI0002B771A0|nr:MULTISPECIES: recombinase family protein [Dehalococcoides]AGG08463.1 resolvase domain protein [Dehalococcoides mccartyi BTF08]AQX75152.1 DNA invertase DsiA [Dehalococcoides mccartyi]KSV17865.1 serine recombinase [Dehalococcoides mccartyi]QYY57583.1 recombinase family protein [Dehalococcoides mccartyi]BAQ35245.1 putative recombinase [Dehalococcoides sp. UCH007]